jgi:hypothetical protein
MIIGNTEPLNIRVDIDQNDAWRVMPGNKARAFVRGNSNEQVNLTFVRFEFDVLPKQSLTGSSNERVDTRVLQAIYEVDSNDVRLLTGRACGQRLAKAKQSCTEPQYLNWKSGNSKASSWYGLPFSRPAQCYPVRNSTFSAVCDEEKTSVTCPSCGRRSIRRTE